MGAVVEALRVATVFLIDLFEGDAFASVFLSKAAQVAAIVSVDSAIRQSLAPDLDSTAPLSSRQLTIQSATSFRTICLGKNSMGGVLTYANVTGTDNRDFWLATTHAGHEVNDIVDMYLDDEKVESADITWGGGVTGGTFYIDGTAYLSLYRGLGTSSDTVISAFDTAFADITTESRGRGCAKTVLKATLDTPSERAWGTSPRNVRAVMEGHPNIYDPRLDSSPGNDPTNAAYQAYTTNPILQAAWYATNDRLGMGEFISTDDVDWQVIADEANFCDQMVPTSVSGTREKRFQSNIILNTGSLHRDNLRDILETCNGRQQEKNGKFSWKAGRLGVGANLITNGDFASDITSWSNGDATAGTLVWSSGEISITNIGAGFGRAVQGVTTVVGSTYHIKANVAGGTAANYLVGVSNNSDGTTPLASETKTNNDSVIERSFVATATTTYFVLQNNVATVSATALFDDVEMYLVAERTIDASYLRADVGVQTVTPKRDRYNTATAFYIAEDKDYKPVTSFEVSNTAFISSRDNGETLKETFELAGVQTEDAAQRILHKRVQATDEMIVARMPCNYRALDVAINDKVMVTLDVFSWSSKLFRVIGWDLAGGDGGIDLVLREDSADAYEDPDLNDYTTRDAFGVISMAQAETPTPSSVSLTFRSDLPILRVSWALPPLSNYDRARVYRNTTNDSGSATMIFEGNTTFFDDVTAAVSTQYYYWVALVLGNEESTRTATSPTDSTAAVIAASTADSVEWAGVLDGAATKPDDNATVGGQLGTNITDETGTNVFDVDVINSYAQSLGHTALNANPFMDKIRADSTPVGYYIARQTGGPAARTALIAYDSSDDALQVLSGSPRPMIVCTAIPFDSGADYIVRVRAKSVGSSTTLQLRSFLYNAVGMETYASFATSLSGNESVVTTANQENDTPTGLATLSVSPSGWSLSETDFYKQMLDGGDNFSTQYTNARWIAFSLQAVASIEWKLSEFSVVAVTGAAFIDDTP